MNPRLAWLVAAALLFPTPAFAQDAQDGDPRTEAPVHVGPFYITPVLELTRLGVDTNVFNASNEPQSDFTFTAGPKIDIAVPIRRFIFTAETVTDFVYYQQFKNQRGVNLDLVLRGEVQLPKLRFFLEDSFFNTNTRPNNEIDVRTRRKGNNLTAGLGIQLFRKLELELSANQSIFKYNDDDVLGDILARTLNREAVRATGLVRYDVTPLTTIIVETEVKTERFEFSPSRDNDSWSVVPGVNFGSRAIIQGSARVGYRDVRGLDESLPPFSGPIVSVDLSHVLLGATTIGFTADRDIEFSFSLLDPYYVLEGYGVSVSQRLSRAFEIRLGADQFDYNYRSFHTVPAVGGSSGRIETTRTYQILLERRFGRRTTVGFDLSYWSRRSNRDNFRSYDGLLAGMTSTFAF